MSFLCNRIGLAYVAARADEPGSGRVSPARLRASSDALCARTTKLPRWPLPRIKSGVASAAVFFSVISAAAAQHNHPPQDEALHEKFYSTWYMPDNPTKSCCNKSDCYPTEIKYVGGNIYARRREDGKYIPIPPPKVERNRDNPDGRSHLCAPPPGSPYAPDIVFCFSLGGGI